MVKELLLLETSQTGGLSEGEKLMSLHLMTNLWSEIRDKAAKEEQRQNPHNAVGQIFKLRLVSHH